MPRSPDRRRAAPPRGAARTVSHHELPVVTPYRLDLTASALRRLASNIVDVITPDGEYARALGGAVGPSIVRVRQARPNALAVTIEAARDDAPRALATVERMLGTQRDLRPFVRAAGKIAWLAPLVRRMRGVKPPRYPTLWEACVNAVLFQQVSIGAASSVMRRFIDALAAPVESAGIPLHVFPALEQFDAARDPVLRGTGLSANKLATLRRISAAIASGELDEAALERMPSEEAGSVLRRIKGIGPWTAAVILLRGFGRLDVFPANDTSVAANVALAAGAEAVDTSAVLDALGTRRGMLYFYLLLGRLEKRGEIGRPSFERAE